MELQPLLLKMPGDEDEYIHRKAFLKAFENDEAKEVRNQVITAFGKWREIQSVNHLVMALKKPQQSLEERIKLVQVVAQIYDDEPLLAFIQPIVHHQGDSDAYISLPDGKLMKWRRAVDIAIDQTLRNYEGK